MTQMPAHYYLLLSILLGFLAVWMTSATPGLFNFLRERSSEIRFSHPVTTRMWFAGVLLPLWGAFAYASLNIIL
jgi:hypothetical protein